MTTDDLDRLLAGAASDRPVPSPALMDRVLADALALQPQPVALRSAPAAQPGLLARVARVFGGGPVLAGVCSAALAGVALGYLSPVTYDYVTGGLADTATDAVELFPTTDFLTSEG